MAKSLCEEERRGERRGRRATGAAGEKALEQQREE